MFDPINQIQITDAEITDIASKIDGVLDGYPEEVSALIKDLDSGKVLYNQNSNRKTRSASCIKLFVLLALADKLMRNGCSFDEKFEISADDILDDSDVFDILGPGKYTLRELATWMYSVSDNSATNVCIKVAGGFDSINAYIQKNLDAPQTEINRLMLDNDAIDAGRDNYTSLHDMCRVFEDLLDEKLLDKGGKYTSDVTEILSQSRSLRIAKRIPIFDFSYMKGGGLERFDICHDAGVIGLYGRRFFAGVFTAYTGKPKPDVIDDISCIGRALYDYANTSWIRLHAETRLELVSSDDLIARLPKPAIEYASDCGSAKNKADSFKIEIDEEERD